MKISALRQSTSADGRGGHSGEWGGFSVPARGPRGHGRALPVTAATGLPCSSTWPGSCTPAATMPRSARSWAPRGYGGKGRGEWSGTYTALVQPEEEIGQGSRAMIDDDLVTTAPMPDDALRPARVADSGRDPGHHSGCGAVRRGLTEDRSAREGRARVDAAPDG